MFTGDPMGVIFARQSSPDTRGADISHLSPVNDGLWCDNWNGSSVSEGRNFQNLENEIEMNEYEAPKHQGFFPLVLERKEKSKSKTFQTF